MHGPNAPELAIYIPLRALKEFAASKPCGQRRDENWSQHLICDLK
jgi:hypothetical protein